MIMVVVGEEEKLLLEQTTQCLLVHILSLYKGVDLVVEVEQQMDLLAVTLLLIV